VVHRRLPAVVRLAFVGHSVGKTTQVVERAEDLIPTRLAADPRPDSARLAARLLARSGAQSVSQGCGFRSDGAGFRVPCLPEMPCRG